VIEGIRNMRDNAGLISIDTFRWDVAKAGILAGANCINDVFAFTGTDYPLTKASAEHFLKMRKLARDLAVPVILMHSRGDASANKDYTDHGSVIEGIRTELGEKVEAAIRGRGGLRRWFVIMDPGVGFSKTVEDNLEVLRHASKITFAKLSGFPQLIGPSRKSFLGTILAQSDVGRSTVPGDRGWATAAAVSCAVQQRALVVRVHDVQEMGDVTIVANSLWAKP
jgi:dihydroneopterin aldolase / 2-amino-4-hydroxy-6-hydroxymethyldihydropteridine diphosphokinase / dihydropteroate synthase